MAATARWPPCHALPCSAVSPPSGKLLLAIVAQFLKRAGLVFTHELLQTEAGLADVELPALDEAAQQLGLQLGPEHTLLDRMLAAVLSGEATAPAPAPAALAAPTSPVSSARSAESAPKPALQSPSAYASDSFEDSSFLATAEEEVAAAPAPVPAPAPAPTPAEEEYTQPETAAEPLASADDLDDELAAFLSSQLAAGQAEADVGEGDEQGEEEHEASELHATRAPAVPSEEHVSPPRTLPPLGSGLDSGPGTTLPPAGDDDDVEEEQLDSDSYGEDSYGGDDFEESTEGEDDAAETSHVDSLGQSVTDSVEDGYELQDMDVVEPVE